MDRIFLTHGHHDHCGGIAQLCNEIGELPVYMNKADLSLLGNVQKEAKSLGLNVGVGIRVKSRFRSTH